jgi:UDP-N-acetylglucosamine 4,6-dehydratase
MSKKILITGGTGSFGNTVLKSLLEDDSYDEIRVFSRDELKQDNLRKLYKDDRLTFFVGDVRDRASLKRAMRSINEVFSAAALKQVPSCEFNPMEAVHTNILGTSNTIDVAASSGVQSIVVLSTDKAVYPINAMGISKAMMEKVAIAKSRDYPDLNINVTRYGNVMGSRGSVIPFFLQCINENRKIPVTDMGMTRFMMSLYDAVDLVKFALNSNVTGSTFVQKSPGATIATLVDALSLYFNKELEVENIGIRHGEKIHETLLSSEEMVRVIDHEDYFEVTEDVRDSNYLHSQNIKQIKEIPKLSSSYSSENTYRLEPGELVSLILKAGLLGEKA